MIDVTRLNGKRFVINAWHIEQMESTPDTVISLSSGRKFIVKEPVEEVISMVKQFYRETSPLHAIMRKGGEMNE
jgi:flagellar protein FlbD